VRSLATATRTASFIDAIERRSLCLAAVVRLSGVRVLQASKAALLCRIEEHVRWIPREHLCEGTTIHRVGDTGVLVVPRAFAVEWGLVPYDG